MMARSSVRRHRSLIDVEVGEIHVAPCCLVVNTQDPVKASNLRATVGELMRYHEEHTALQVFALI